MADDALTPRLVTAVGNHLAGYAGTVEAWSCDHRHATTKEARTCAVLAVLTSVEPGILKVMDRIPTVTVSVANLRRWGARHADTCDGPAACTCGLAFALGEEKPLDSMTVEG